MYKNLKPYNQDKSRHHLQQGKSNNLYYTDVILNYIS